MDKDRILAILREHEAELKAAGLLHLRLFGSVARGENTPTSDVDLLADFDPDRSPSLFALAHHRNQLTDLLGTDVHLSNREAMHSYIRDKVMPRLFLPSEQQVRHLRDIVDAIHHIQQLTLGMSLEDFQADQRTKWATERLLQILTEAAHRLGREAPAICPEVNWRDVRGFGNFLRHEYDQVLSKSVWTTIHEDLPPLLLAVENAIHRISSFAQEPIA